MRRTHERGTKARLSFSGGPHAPANMADQYGRSEYRWEKCRKCYSGNVCCAVLRYIPYAFPNPWSSTYGPSIASLNPETVELAEFSILSAIFTASSFPGPFPYPAPWERGCIYRNVWPAREAKPRFTAFERSAHARVVKFTYELKLISTWKDLHKASLWNRGKRQLAILAFSWANITPSFILNLSMARLCLWCTIVDVVTTIGIRCAVSLYVEWHRSLKMALLMALQRSTLLLSFLRLTEKQGTIVSGPISRRNAMASLSWSQNVHVNLD